jgi:hypothetical protein
MAGEDWPSFAHREQDTGKVDRLAQRLRQRRKERPKDPDDGLSPLDRTLKANYPELWTDPVWSAMHET